MNPQVSAVLRVAAERALGGNGSVVLVTGESGLGKSSLLRGLAVELADEFRVLEGACDDVSEPPRLGPLREAGWAVDLGYQELLAGLGEVPTALLVDDIQWADDATLDLVGYLARRVDGRPLLVVLTLADDSRLPERLHRWLGGLATAGARRLPLAPLGLDEVRRRVAGSGAEQLYALTGGNPFYLSAMLAAAPGTGVPDAICDAVLAKAVRLSDACRSVVEQLAVLPGTIDLRLVERLTDGDEELLAEAEQYGLLEARHEGIGFRYEIVRLAIEQGMPGLTRRRLHQRALDVQAPEGDRYLARLAHHAIAAVDVETVGLYAPRAGQQAAAAGAREEALRMFDAASRLGVLPAENRAGYAWELFNAYRFDEAAALGVEFDFLARVELLETLYHERRWDELASMVAEGNRPERDLLATLRALVQLRRGDWEGAEAGLDALGSHPSEFVRSRVEPIAARLLLRRGMSVDPKGEPSYVVPVLVEQAFLAGDVERVTALRDEWRELESTPVWPEIHRYCVRAGVEPPTGDWKQAAQEWARLGDSYEQALELAQSGETEPTLEALRLLDELDARPAADLVRRRLRKLGLRAIPRGPVPTTRAHPVGLTARQADVLTLIAEGLTNAEIAKKLVVSVRTVDHHVSAILARLNTRTRREAARYAKTLDLIPATHRQPA